MQEAVGKAPLSRLVQTNCIKVPLATAGPRFSAPMKYPPSWLADGFHRGKGGECFAAQTCELRHYSTEPIVAEMLEAPLKQLHGQLRTI